MIKNLRLDEPMEMTFEIHDADMKVLQEILCDINIKECPWFEIHDKHGNKAKYYREPLWIPCGVQLPRQGQEVICQCRANMIRVLKLDACGDWYQDAEHCYMSGFVIAWMPLPESYSGETKLRD